MVKKGQNIVNVVKECPLIPFSCFLTWIKYTTGANCENSMLGIGFGNWNLLEMNWKQHPNTWKQDVRTPIDCVRTKLCLKALLWSGEHGSGSVLSDFDHMNYIWSVDLYKCMPGAQKHSNLKVELEFRQLSMAAHFQNCVLWSSACSFLNISRKI